MVKVKLRVPLSSAPRETSSPLANPLRSAPDYSDDESISAPQAREVTTPDASATPLDAEDEEAGSLNSDDDADELDELDELEEEDGTPGAVANSSTPKRITLKPRSSSGPGGGGSASPSAEGSASPAQKVRRGNMARIAQVQAMTVEELDALPAAKRRKTAKARGAAGPGRGWRKGLTKGQKPVYELPSAGTTPATFGDTTNARSSPAIGGVSSAAGVKSEGTPTPSTSLLPKSRSSSTLAAAARPTTTTTCYAGGGSSSIKIVSGPGGQTFTGDLSAKAGTAKNPGFRYPPLPSSRAGPPVQPIARIPTAFQTVIPLERNGRQPRRWIRQKREILSMGGRPWSIPVFYGGEDRGYEKKVDAPITATAAVGAGGGGAGAGGDKTAAATASKVGTPSTGAKAVSPTPTPTPTATAQASNTKLPAAAGGGGSPLPPPKHLAGLASQAETNWRGQSPAFLFGGR